jgi:release factor glutamine methyltransferase
VTEAGVLLFVHGGCTFTVADGVQPPKAGSLLFCRHLPVRAGDRMLEIGTGIGLAAVLAARGGARVVATDVVDAAVRCARANAVVNGVADRVEVLQGDGFAPVRGRVFDLICTSPPQMPTPPERERADATAAADNGGRDGWALLDRVIAPTSRRAADSSSRYSASSASRPRSPGSTPPGSSPRSWARRRSPSLASATSGSSTSVPSTRKPPCRPAGGPPPSSGT